MTLGNEPAYPVVRVDSEQYYGLTKREVFAKSAMQGLTSLDEYLPENIAVQAINIADALLTELERSRK